MNTNSIRRRCDLLLIRSGESGPIVRAGCRAADTTFSSGGKSGAAGNCGAVRNPLRWSGYFGTRLRNLCQQAARFSSRGGVEGHAFERPFWRCVRVGGAAGPRGDLRERRGRRRNHAAGRRGESLRWDGQGASCLVLPHEPQPDAITQPRRSELGAGIKPGPRDSIRRRVWFPLIRSGERGPIVRADSRAAEAQFRVLAAAWKQTRSRSGDYGVGCSGIAARTVVFGLSPIVQTPTTAGVAPGPRETSFRVTGNPKQFNPRVRHLGIRLRPGDVLVVKINTHLSKEHAEKVHEMIAGKLPEGVKAMVVSSEFDFLVLSAAEIEQQTRSAV